MVKMDLKYPLWQHGTPISLRQCNGDDEKTHDGDDDRDHNHDNDDYGDYHGSNDLEY